MIRCSRCHALREAAAHAVARAILGAASLIDTQTEKLKGQRMAKEKLTAVKSRSGDEWEVQDANRVVKSNGFDNEQEAEEWITEQAKRKPK